MRPNLFITCLGAWCSCAMISAQTPDQRPSNLRDSGVVTRAAPPTISPNASQASAMPNAGSKNPSAPVNFPTAPAASTASSLGDQAWTGTPARSHPTSRLTDTPAATAYPSSVVPAQFTQPSTGNQAISPQGTASPSSTGHQPRPLKPPTSAESKANSKGSTGTVQMFISVISSLAIVIGLILASAWFYRKAAPTMSGALPKQVVQVLGRTPLAPRQQLVLLRLGSKLVLVSNLHGEVRTISEIDDPLEVDRLAGLCEAAQPGSISESFRSVLHNIGRNG